MLAQVDGWVTGALVTFAGLLSGAAVWLRGIWKEYSERRDRLEKEALEREERMVKEERERKDRQEKEDRERKERQDKEMADRRDVERKTTLAEWQEWAGTLRKEYEARVSVLQVQLDRIQQATIDCEKERSRLEVSVVRQEGQISILTMTVDNLQRASGHTAPTLVPTVVTADSKGMIWYVGDGMMELLKYMPSQLLGKSVELLIPERYLGRHRTGMSKLRALQVAPWQDKVIPGEALARDGQEVPVTIKLVAWRISPDESHPAGEWMITATIRKRMDRPPDVCAGNLTNTSP